jgi:preprotein translocase subunit SecG
VAVVVVVAVVVAVVVVVVVALWRGQRLSAGRPSDGGA